MAVAGSLGSKIRFRQEADRASRRNAANGNANCRPRHHGSPGVVVNDLIHGTCGVGDRFTQSLQSRLDRIYADGDPFA